MGSVQGVPEKQVNNQQEKKYYKGEFACSVYMYDKKTKEYKLIKNAEDFFFEKDNNSFENITELMEQHLLKVIGNIASPYRISSGFGGDEGDGSGYFYLPFKLETIPDMYFEVDNIQLYNLTNKEHTSVSYKINADEKISRFVMKFNIDLQNE